MDKLDYLAFVWIDRHYLAAWNEELGSWFLDFSNWLSRVPSKLWDEYLSYVQEVLNKKCTMFYVIIEAIVKFNDGGYPIRK
ncbi:hypothetical protein P791_2131 [Enterococcus faecalis NY9]|nr:hypothetical protein P791_2131 [Enterococcus faecalis NY9]